MLVTPALPCSKQSPAPLAPRCHPRVPPRVPCWHGLGVLLSMTPSDKICIK